MTRTTRHVNRNAPPRGRLLTLSDHLYRALLLIYPRAFRRKFGPQMAQVFRTSCKQVHRERGAMGLLGLWAGVVGDLVLNALLERLTERLSQEVHMTRATFVRASGAATMLGGTLYLLGPLFHPSGPARAVVPGTIVCLILGILGLHARMWGREGWLGWLGAALVALGLTPELVGMTSWVLTCASGCRAAVGSSPDPVAQVLNNGEFAGLVFIGAGMMLWGVVAVRLRALGRGWSVLPLLIGLLSMVRSMVGVAFLLPAAFAAVESIVLESSVLPLVYAACWILLGFALVIAKGRGDTLTVSAAPPIPNQPVAG